MQELKIMIVDDSPFSINLIEELLSKNGYKVVAKASNKEEMLEKFLETKPNFITMDLTMPDIDGFESIKLLRKINPDFNSIMISSLKDDDLVRESKKLKINDYLQKPLKEEELLKSISLLRIWTDGFNKVNTATEDLMVINDFYREGEATEDELVNQYNNCFSLFF